VIRSGLALPVTLNLPLALIDTAAVTKAAPRGGSIALTVAKPNRVAWLVLWPNVKPWTFNNPQPMLQCIEKVDEVARTLARALEGDATVSPVRAARPIGTTQPVGVTIAA